MHQQIGIQIHMVASPHHINKAITASEVKRQLRYVRYTMADRHHHQQAVTIAKALHKRPIAVSISLCGIPVFKFTNVIHVEIVFRGVVYHRRDFHWEFQGVCGHLYGLNRARVPSISWMLREVSSWRL